MKRLILSTILTFISVTLWADGYSRTNLTLEIHTNDGQIITAYSIFGANYMLNSDSISSTDYMISKLILMSIDDSIICFKNRLNYHYESEDNERNSIYVYLTPLKIAPSDIKKIKVLKNELSPSIYGIANPLELKDTSWMQTNIVDVIWLSGPFCSFAFYIHKKNPKLYRIIEEIKPLVEEYENAITKEENLNQENLNSKIDKLFSETRKFETVVISMCAD